MRRRRLVISSSPLCFAILYGPGWCCGGGRRRGRRWFMRWVGKRLASLGANGSANYRGVEETANSFCYQGSKVALWAPWTHRMWRSSDEGARGHDRGRSRDKAMRVEVGHLEHSLLSLLWVGRLKNTSLINRLTYSQPFTPGRVLSNNGGMLNLCRI